MSVPAQLVFREAFSRSDIAEVERLAAAEPATANDHTVGGRETRMAEARWIECDHRTIRILALVTAMFEAANQNFHFDIDAVREPMMHVTYPPCGHFEWHTDSGPGRLATRKLSMSVLLAEANEFAGGELEFCPGGRLTNEIVAGTAIVFPSFMAHRVTPITRGHRRALVAWMHGRAFR